MSAHRALGFAISLTSFDRFSLVVTLLPAGEREFDLRAAVAEIHSQRNQRKTLLGYAMIESVDFLTMEQQLAPSLRVRGIRARCGLVGRDMQLLKPSLAAIYRAEAIAHIRATVTETLHLGTHERDSRFESVDDLVVEARTAIRRDDEPAFRVELIRVLFLARLGHGLAE